MTAPGTCEFSCRRCGDCCRKHGLYPVTASDVGDMSRYLGISIAAFLSAYCTVTTHDGRRGLFLRGDRGACPFLSGSECAIHPCKPRACAIFPDNDGHVTVDRLKAGARDATVRGSGLSRCSIWDLPDGGILAPEVEATVRFRIREDTDSHYFSRKMTIDPDVVEHLASLAELRLHDLPLYLLTAQKYGLLRQFHAGKPQDASALVQVERDILYRYAATYAAARMLREVVIRCRGVRATYVEGQPVVELLCDRPPPSAGCGHFLWRRYGETGIFAALIEQGRTGYVTAFLIHTPCLADIVSDGTLRLRLNGGERKLIVSCEEGIH